MPEKKWRIYPQASQDLVEQLLFNRGLKREEEKKEFLHPSAPLRLLPRLRRLSSSLAGNLEKAVKRIKAAVGRGEPIIIHGDFDVDGICGTAILWEAIYRGWGYKNVHPFVPNRFSDGYGFSEESVEKIKSELGVGLLITVDCGITAAAAVEYARSLGMGVVITDHHQLPEERRAAGAAEALVWTDRLCGAGIAWMLAAALLKGEKEVGRGLDLVALATIADLQPLLGPNRSLVKFGLEKLNETARVGLKALIKAAGLEGRRIDADGVGWRLAPRLNAAGRLETALGALRLLCTQNKAQAEEIAERLNVINVERQKITEEAFRHAREQFAVGRVGKVMMAAHESYHEGIVGLVAAKLVREFYRPALVIAKGSQSGVFSKGSARSISGFDITAALREVKYLFEDLGGHPMAAGFTMRTEKIALLEEALLEVSARRLPDDLLRPVVKIDAEVGFSSLNFDFLRKLKQLEPFGVGNPRPVFLTRKAVVLGRRTVGAERKHLRLLIAEARSAAGSPPFSAIFFNHGGLVEALSVGDKIDLVYCLEENEWRGEKRLELKVKDLKKAGSAPKRAATDRRL